MLERRALDRRAVQIDGKLIFADGQCILDCVIVDITMSGARIALGLELTAPARVYLWQKMTGTVFECEVRWQDRTTVGLRFVDTCGKNLRRALVEACTSVPAGRSRIARWLGQDAP